MKLKHPKFKFIFITMKIITGRNGHLIKYPEIIYTNDVIYYICLMIRAIKKKYKPVKTDYFYVTGQSDKKLQLVWTK